MRIGTARRSGVARRALTALGRWATAVMASAAPGRIARAAAVASNTSNPRQLVLAARPPMAPPRLGLPAAALCEDGAVGRFQRCCGGPAAGDARASPAAGRKADSTVESETLTLRRL